MTNRQKQEYKEGSKEQKWTACKTADDRLREDVVENKEVISKEEGFLSV